MAAYNRFTKNGMKLWLVDNKRGGWLLQYRPSRSMAELVSSPPGLNPEIDYDTDVYVIRIQEIERRKIFTVLGDKNSQYYHVREDPPARRGKR